MAFEVGLMEPLELYLCPLGVWSSDPFQRLPQGREVPTESSGCVPRSINPWSYEGLELFMGHFSDPWSRSLGLPEVGKLPGPGGKNHWAAPGAGMEDVVWTWPCASSWESWKAMARLVLRSALQRLACGMSWNHRLLGSQSWKGQMDQGENGL